MAGFMLVLLLLVVTYRLTVHTKVTITILNIQNGYFNGVVLRAF